MTVRIRIIARSCEEISVRVLDALLTALFLGISLVAILRVVLADGAVTRQRIRGALAGYLLLDVVWSLIHAALETASRGPTGTSPLARGVLRSAVPLGLLQFHHPHHD